MFLGAYTYVKYKQAWARVAHLWIQRHRRRKTLHRHFVAQRLWRTGGARRGAGQAVRSGANGGELAPQHSERDLQRWLVEDTMRQSTEEFIVHEHFKVGLAPPLARAPSGRRGTQTPTRPRAQSRVHELTGAREVSGPRARRLKTMPVAPCTQWRQGSTVRGNPSLLPA